MRKALSRLIPVLGYAVPTLLAASSSAQDLSGSWSGSMTRDQGGSGEVNLALSRDGATWTASGQFRVGGHDSSNPIRDLRVQGSEVSFRTKLNPDIEVSFAGKLVSDKLTGRFEAVQAGRVAGTGPWSLSRSAAPKAPSAAAGNPKDRQPAAAQVGTGICVQARQRIVTCKNEVAEALVRRRNPPADQWEQERRIALKGLAMWESGSLEQRRQDCARSMAGKGTWSQGWLDAKRAELDACAARPDCKERAACLAPLLLSGAGSGR